jgi:hypothetical protein
MTSITDVLHDFAPMEGRDDKLYGKYRGVVLNNVDPLGIGRIQVSVPGIVTPPSTWAMPCAPVAGIQHGAIMVPPLGAGVWVEYEQGDLDFPIWTGCYWGTVAEMPRTAFLGTAATPNIVHQTVGQNSITIYGAPGGGLSICAGPFESPTSPRIEINAAGITLSDGKGGVISIAAGVVTINLGALLVK